MNYFGESIASSTRDSASLFVMAVVSLYRWSIFVTKHDVYRSAEELESILQSHSVMSVQDAIEFVEYTDPLPEPIDGIPIVEEGYKCLRCLYHAGSWPVMLQSASSRKESEPGE
jgi:hypothetical protein